MAINIVEMLQNAVGKELGGQASKMFGESEQATGSALQSALPALLGGVMNKASSLAGATDLLNIIKGPAVKPDLLLKDLGGLFGGGEATNQAVSLGQTLLNAIFGDKIGALASAIGSLAGVRSTSASGLLSMLAPLLFSFLKGQVTSNNLSAAGLMSLLGSQSQFLQGKLSDSVTNALGLGSAASFLGGISGKLQGASARIPTQGSAGISAPIGGPAGRPPTGDDGGYSTLRKLRPWLLLLLGIPLFFLFRSCGQEEPADLSGSASTPTASRPATEAPAKSLESVRTLPTASPAEVTPMAPTEVPAAPTETPAPTAAPPEPTVDAKSGANEPAAEREGLTESNTPEPAASASEVPAVASAPPAARVYFDLAKIALPKSVDQILQQVVDYAVAHPQSKVVVAGFHDPSGNQAKNAALAKNRAGAVRARLIALGVHARQLEMKKPAVTTGSGDNKEARRVEVTVEQ